MLVSTALDPDMIQALEDTAGERPHIQYGSFLTMKCSFKDRQESKRHTSTQPALREKTSHPFSPTACLVLCSLLLYSVYKQSDGVFKSGTVWGL